MQKLLPQSPFLRETLDRSSNYVRAYLLDKALESLSAKEKGRLTSACRVSATRLKTLLMMSNMSFPFDMRNLH